MEEPTLRARRGDAAAVQELIAMYEADMYRTAFVYMKNEADALDVVQDAAFKAFRAVRTLKEPGYVKTWLIRITINCALDRIRREKRSLPTLTEAEAAGHEGETLTKIALEGLMNALDDKEKQTVLLRFYSGCTITDIAREMKRPPGSVKTTLYRALKKLRIKAEEEGLNE